MRPALLAFIALAMMLSVVAGGVAPANALVVGKCTIKIGNSHASTHVSGTINALSSITCTIGMPRLHIQTWLERRDGARWTGKASSWVSAPPGKKAQSNAATSCSAGPAQFRNRTYLSFTSPPRVTPASYAKTYYSNWGWEACGLARSAGESGQLAADVEFLEDGTIEFSEPYVQQVR